MIRFDDASHGGGTCLERMRRFRWPRVAPKAAGGWRLARRLKAKNRQVRSSAAVETPTVKPIQMPVAPNCLCRASHWPKGNAMPQ